MKEAKSFAEALKLSLVNESPYWLFIFAIGLLCSIIDSEFFNAIVMLTGLYAGVGAFVVFSVLKIKSNQNTDKFDLAGAGKNIYAAIWWPWYLFQAKK